MAFAEVTGTIGAICRPKSLQLIKYAHKGLLLFIDLQGWAKEYEYVA